MTGSQNQVVGPKQTHYPQNSCRAPGEPDHHRYIVRLSRYTVDDPLGPRPSTCRLVSSVEPHPSANADGTVASMSCSTSSSHTDS